MGKKIVILIGSLCAFLSACGSSRPSSSEVEVFGPRQNIVGGSAESNRRVFESTVGIEISDGHFCTGAYIGKYKVLTAAHCLEEHGAGAPRNVVERVNFFSSEVTLQGIPKIQESCAAKEVQFVGGFQGADTYWINDEAVVNLDPASCQLDSFHTFTIPADDTLYWRSDTLISGFGNVSLSDNLGHALPLKTLVNDTHLSLKTSDQFGVIFDQVAQPDETQLRKTWTKKMSEAQYLQCYAVQNEASPFFGDSGGPLYTTAQDGSLLLLGTFSSFYQDASNHVRMYCFSKVSSYLKQIWKN